MRAIAKEPWMPKAFGLWTTGLVVHSFEIIALSQVSIFYTLILFSININKVLKPFKAMSFPHFSDHINIRFTKLGSNLQVGQLLQTVYA